MNEINFGKNGYPIFRGKSLQTAQNIQGAVPGGDAGTPQGRVAQNYNPLKNAVYSLILMQNSQTVLVDKTMSGVLKNLLNMQKELGEFLMKNGLNKDAEFIDEMISQSPEKTVTKDVLAKLLLGAQTDVSKLAEFMSKNGKDALEKLFKLNVEAAQTGGLKNSQMSEITAILKACVPNSDTSAAQVAKNIMLLYLPWLPLGVQNAFTLEFGVGSDEEGAAGDDFVSIKIATVNYGNISILIFKTGSNSIAFKLSADETFPNEEFEKSVLGEIKEYNVKAQTEFEKLRRGVDKHEKFDNSGKTKVEVSIGNKINPFLFLVAQTAIKTVVEIDKKSSLNDVRKEKL